VALRRPNVPRMAASNDIAGLVKAARYKKDPSVREAARTVLTEKVDYLIQQLAAKHLPHVFSARDGLVIVGEPARDRLIFIVQNGHVHRRQDAAFVLGVMGDPAAVKPLCVAMHNPDPMLRMIVVEALGKIGDPAATDTLRRAVGDPEVRISKAAQKALRQVASPQA
jgi:HEAT repeat protein